jgi:RNA polymerase sigma-70 factor, ECF subfamily
MKQLEAVASETLLLEQAKAGDSEAFSELVRLNSSKIYGISLKILKNREDAEDNLQNAFYKAFRKIHNFQGESRVSTWLFRIAINEALMQLRRRKEKDMAHFDATSEVASLPEVEDPRSAPEKRCINLDLAEKALCGCTAAVTNIFVLNKVEGWTHRELAKVFGISAQTVKSRIFRTRVRIRQRINALARVNSPVSGH